MNKESQGVKYFKLDWRRTWKDISYGFTSRNDDDDVFSRNFETFMSVGLNKKKSYGKIVEVEVTFDGYLPPDENGDTNLSNFEFEDKFNVEYKLSEKVSIYNMGEVYQIKGVDFYKAKIGINWRF